MASILAWAAPNQLTYQGRILKADGAPLEYNNVSFIFEIASPNGSCILYREQKNGINMVNSGGVFDVPIGSGSMQYPAPPFKLSAAFANTTSLTCEGGSPYNPLAEDGRVLKVQFYDGSGWKQISPDSIIRSVPYAHHATSAANAGTVGGYAASDFLLKAGLPSCGPGTFLTYNGAILTCAAVSGASGGTVTDVTSANSYLSITNGTSTPQLTLNVGTAANTVAAGDDSRFTNARIPTGAAGGDLASSYPNPTIGKLQGTTLTLTTPTSGQYIRHDGSAFANSPLLASDLSGTVAVGSVPNLPWSKITSGLPTTLAGYGIADAVKNAGGTVSLETGSDAAKGTAGTAGRIYLATDTQRIYSDNGSSWVVIASVSTMTGVSVSAPLTSSGGGNPTIGIPKATGSVDGYLAATDFAIFNGKLGTSLANGSIWIGNGSGVATAVSPSGDISLTNAGVTKVAKIQNITVSTTTPSSAGHVLRYDGSTQYAPGFLSLSDIHSSVVPTDTAFPTTSCTPKQTLTWISLTDKLACTTISVEDSQITYASKGQNLIFAGPASGGAGAPSFRSLASSDLPANAYDNTYFKNGGNSFGAATSIGTNDGNALSFKTNNVSRMTLDTSGRLFVGATGSEELHVTNHQNSGTFFKADNTTADTASKAGFIAKSDGAEVEMAVLSTANTQTFGGIDGADSFLIRSFSTTPVSSMILGNGGAAPIHLLTADLPRMTVSAAGEVGIGTTTPTAPLDITKDSSAWVRLQQSSNDNNGPAVGFVKTRGTVASPAAVTTGDRLMGLYGMGYHSGPGTSGNVAAIQFLAAEPFTAAANGTKIDFATTPIGGTARSTRMLIDDAGYVGIGNGSPTTGLEISKSNLWTTVNWNKFLKFSGAGSSAIEFDLAANNKFGIGATASNNSFNVWKADSSTNTAAINYLLSLTETSLNVGSSTANVSLVTRGDVSVGVDDTDLATREATYGKKLYFLGANSNTDPLWIARYNVSGVPNNTDLRVNIGDDQLSASDTFAVGVTNGSTWYRRFFVGGAGLIGNSQANPGDTGTIAVPGGTGVSAMALNIEAAAGGYAGQFINSSSAADAHGVNIYLNGAAASNNILMGRSNGNTRFYVKADGSGFLTNAWSSSSDIRLKKNIERIPSSLDKILQIEGITYDWKDESRGTSRQIGVIAQDVQKVFPEAVTKSPDGYLAVTYSTLVAPLINAVKEIYSELMGTQKEVSALKARTERLEKENQEMKSYLCQKDPSAPFCM
ncbi:tail fiber domain-containing protein [Bdellovibrio bacteriovorus]|nr:tail fiber domain-containing protein [Bdellovibrio bacteriovorus]